MATIRLNRDRMNECDDEDGFNYYIFLTSPFFFSNFYNRYWMNALGNGPLIYYAFSSPLPPRFSHVVSFLVIFALLHTAPLYTISTLTIRICYVISLYKHTYIHDASVDLLSYCYLAFCFLFIVFTFCILCAVHFVRCSFAALLAILHSFPIHTLPFYSITIFCQYNMPFLSFSIVDH